MACYHLPTACDLIKFSCSSLMAIDKAYTCVEEGSFLLYLVTTDYCSGKLAKPS